MEEADISKDSETLFLYVFEYFIAHKVHQQAIYARDLDAAIISMNTFYARSGLGSDHKSLTRNTAGITINGTYHPPSCLAEEGRGGSVCVCQPPLLPCNGT